MFWPDSKPTSGHPNSLFPLVLVCDTLKDALSSLDILMNNFFISSCRQANMQCRSLTEAIDDSEYSFNTEKENIVQTNINGEMTTNLAAFYTYLATKEAQVTYLCSSQ